MNHSYLQVHQIQFLANCHSNDSHAVAALTKINDGSVVNQLEQLEAGASFLGSWWPVAVSSSTVANLNAQRTNPNRRIHGQRSSVVKSTERAGRSLSESIKISQR